LHGCQNCGFWKDNCYRFFEFDHIDIKEKLDKIANLVRDDKWNIEQLLEECKKCRLLCRNCHTIHSSNQRAQRLY